MPLPPVPNGSQPHRQRRYYRHFYEFQLPMNMLNELMDAAVAVQQHPDRLVGAAILHFLSQSTEEQGTVLAEFEAYAPVGQDTPGHRANGRINPPPQKFPKEQWERYWREWSLAKETEDVRSI